jgi:hypothetical protein
LIKRVIGKMLVLRLIVFHISCEVKRGIDEVDPRALPEPLWSSILR